MRKAANTARSPDQATSRVEPLTLSIADAVRWSGICRSELYVLIGAGKLKALKSGRKTLVVAASLREHVENLPAAQIRPQGRAHSRAQADSQ
jgi:hypothetical protein